MSDAARRPVLLPASAPGSPAAEEADSSSDGAWPGEAEQLSLVLDASRFDRIVAEAAAWADRITLCLTAPHSQRGSLPWWQELLARSSKCERIYLRRPEQTEAWLLHRLQETGALSVVESGGKQVAGNLLMFVRSSEIRVLLAHIPLERAVAGAAFGALLAFRGSGTSEIVRSCRAQAESWAKLGRIPTGSEIDALGGAVRRSEPAPSLMLPTGLLRLVSDPKELEACVERLRAAGLESPALDGGWAVSVRGFDGGVRVEFQHRDKARTPVVLTLQAGSAWPAGNAVLLETREGEVVLAWRGGLLGHSRAKCELLWSQARLATFPLEDAALGPAQRVALVARTGAALAPQLGAFARETCRLGELFGVEPPPTLGHAVAEFGSLSPKQQTLLLWRALLGLGALDFGVATLCAAQALRDQGYVRGTGSESGGLYGAVAELLAKAAANNPGFDRPGLGKLRAIQPDVSAYVLDDWQECLLQALPENQSVARRRALRLGFERARSHWGLSGVELRPNGRVERILESTLASGLRRGLFVRVGAGGVKRLAPLNPPADLSVSYRSAPGASEDGLLAGWSRALAQLSSAQRFLLTRRSGWYCRRETLESAGQRLGLTLERARQLEVEAWQSIENESDWARTLRDRLARAFAGAGFLPVRLLTREDPWWRGIDRHPGLAEAVFESLLGGEVQRVELGPPPRREVLFARFSQAELDRTLETLLERAAQLPTPALLEDVLALPAVVAEPLDAGLCEYLRDALEARLELDPADPARVLGLLPDTGATLEHLPEPHGIDSEGRLRLEDAARSAFRSARTPLSLSAIAERIRQRIDVDEQALAVLLSHAPFVQRNADQYGLLARDVPGGHEAIATALNAVVETLDQSLRVLHLRDAFALVQAQVEQPWSTELVRSLIRSDPALCLSATLDVRLSRWEHARLVAATELICPGVPAAARPRFEKLNQAAAIDSNTLSGQLRTQLSRLERSGGSDDFVTLSLARQLCDLYLRLVEHTAPTSTQSQQLAQAAIRYYLEATATDEDDLEAPGVDRERLTEAREVLAAVLAQLDLDWLEPKN
jgi:Sigma-70, region 4